MNSVVQPTIIGGAHKRRETHRFGGLVSLHPRNTFYRVPLCNYAHLSYVISFPDVQSYLSFCENEDTSILRPQMCSHCGVVGPLNRHGHYKRPVWCDDGSYLIPIFRFQCPLCERTTGVLPSFIGRYERCTWDVQEDVLMVVDAGTAIEHAGVTVSPPTGPLSSRTVWRWLKRWRMWMNLVEEQFWQHVISLNPALSIPRGRDRPATKFTLFQQIWRQVTPECMGIRVLHAIFQRCKPMGSFNR